MKNKVLPKLLLILLGIMVIISPFSVFILVAHNQKHVYTKTYYAALVDKIDYLSSLEDEKKIVLIGGSNVAFGFDSELIEKEFSDYKVVNFGLYAALGTKVMLDLAYDYINEGDMVFVIPEINPQSMSLFFNPDGTLKAIEDRLELVSKLPEDNRKTIIGSYFDFVKERGKYSELIDPGETVYRRDNFNRYFDISYKKYSEDGELISLRTQNIMKSKRYNEPKVKFEIDSTSEPFFEYLNNYHQKILEKKANVYYSFCPVNELSNVSSDEEISSFYWDIREKTSIPVIGNPSDYIIDAHYFYDSNFHMNDSGAIYRTYLFCSDVYRDILNISKTPSFNIPLRPEYPPVDATEEDDSDTVIYFNLVENEDGYAIASIKEEYSSLKEVRLPQFYNHKYVTNIYKNAFADAHELETIVVPGTYNMFDDGAFDNCEKLLNIYLETLIPSELIVSFTGGLLNNVSDDLLIYVPEQSINAYRTDYNWQFYYSYLKGYSYEEN